MTAAVTAHAVSRFFDFEGHRVVALRDVSIRVERGAFVALVGPSGCGKSTLLNILGLADAPSAGEVSLVGERIDFGNEGQLVRLRRSAVGFVFQSFNLLPTLTALENVMMPLVLQGVPSRNARSRSFELLERVGVGAKAEILPTRLSGGEMQRVAVARAVAHRPALVLADEPTGNLDSVSGDAVLDLLSSLTVEGTAVLMATHSEAAVSRCSSVIRVKDGVLV